MRYSILRLAVYLPLIYLMLWYVFIYLLRQNQDNRLWIVALVISVLLSYIFSCSRKGTLDKNRPLVAFFGIVMAIFLWFCAFLVSGYLILIPMWLAPLF